MRKRIKSAIDRLFEGVEAMEKHFKERRVSGEALFFSM